MDDDKELGPIPMHVREAPESTDYYAHPRRVFAQPSRCPIHPRSEVARILRAVDRRCGTTDSLKEINYGPVELALRTLLARLRPRWRR